MTNQAVRQYLALTSAAHRLSRMSDLARQLDMHVNCAPVIDHGDMGEPEPPVCRCLDHLRDRAGLAAIGEGDPITRDEWTVSYSGTVRSRLDQIASAATGLADLAHAVIADLDAGLITEPREWTADEITTGAMRDALDPDSHWCDDSFLWDCITALRRHRDSRAIGHAVYDRHMSLIDRQHRNNDSSEGSEGGDTDSSRVREAIASWTRRKTEADNALHSPVPYREAARLIDETESFDRLAHYLRGLTVSGWQHTREDRETADRLMIRLLGRIHSIGDVDAAGMPLTETPLPFLAEQWRTEKFDVDVAVDPDDGTDLEEARLQLYIATQAAVTTTEMLHVWENAAVLDERGCASIRTTIVLAFEHDRTGIGVPLRDDGPHAAATRELRGLVDQFDMTEVHLQTRTYRQHVNAVRELDMSRDGSDTRLAQLWHTVTGEKDKVTSRQFDAIRDAFGDQIAAWGGSDEQRAAALRSRLIGFDRDAS